MKKYRIIFTLLIITVISSFCYDDSLAQSPVPASAKLEQLVSGLKQPEGPVWVDGLGLLFSDIRANVIYEWSPNDSTLMPHLFPSDSSNGLTLDLQGRLVLTQMAKRQVARQEKNSTITPLASTYNGKKFNSPNDLVVKSDGSIFFTDPDFNTPLGQIKEMGFRGVFRISTDNTIKLLDSTFIEPNGICFSPDESKLYVNESPQGKIYVWDILNDSTIANKRLFYTIPLGGYADGMKVDPDSNIYCTGPKGVWIISPKGEFLDTIWTPINPSNCAWGDADRRTLYITAGNSQYDKPIYVGLYRIRLGSNTDVKGQGTIPVKSFKLFNNYPNPFNPSTIIEYEVLKSGFISLKIYDTLGREITTLVNGFKHAGTYHLKWDASGFPSGIYFCRLQDEKGGEQTRKILLLK